MEHLVRESAGAAREPSLSNSSRTLLPARRESTKETRKRRTKEKKREKEERRWENTRMLIVQASLFFFTFIRKKNFVHAKRERAGRALPLVSAVDRGEKELNHRALQSCYLNAAIAFTCFTR